MYFTLKIFSSNCKYIHLFLTGNHGAVEAGVE
jgi:hypothetical protein